MSTLCLRSDGRIWQCVYILVFLLIPTDGLCRDCEKFIVSTQWGFLQGKGSKTVRNRTVANFLGIPYALPPVGDLRFKSPQRWNRTWLMRDAKVDGQKCIQFDKETFEVIGSEDCLYLNIFVPCISDQLEFTSLPVLVHVHGGAFVTGSSDSELYAPDYLMDQDIILVTLNYRLSALGFFSTANQVSPGNYGIKDIKMALEWIQQNIHDFEGDPRSVTLMGHSSGSIITHILALSKKTEGLFHRYILLSGSALNTWSFHPRTRYRQVCLKLAKLVGCLKKDDDVIAWNDTTTDNPEIGDDISNGTTTDDPEIGDGILYPDYKVKEIKNDEEIMKCMRTVDARKLEMMTRYFSVWRLHPMCNFGPTLEDDSENAILTMHPLKILKNGLFRDIPAIIQVVRDEGLLKTVELFAYPDAENELIENFEKYLPYFMECHEVISNTSVFVSAIQDFYFSGNVTLGLMHNITKMFSDAIIWSMFQTLQYLSELGNSSIYFSFFTYEGTFSTTFSWGKPIHYGIAHGDNLNYLFPILNNKYKNMLLNNTENDITMINIMTEMWANFVTKGIPTARMISAWPNYRDHHKLMIFGIGEFLCEIVLQVDFLSDGMEFWEKLMINETAEFANDVFVNESSEDAIIISGANSIIISDANAIDRRLTIQLASLAIIFIYNYIFSLTNYIYARR